MKKREAKQHSSVETWVRWYLETIKKNCKVEIKHTRGETSMPFSELEEHQLRDLLSFEEAPFVHKFDDQGYRKKPSDIIGVVQGHSFIAVRYNTFIAIIPVNRWVKETEEKRKSLTEDRAKAICLDTILIDKTK